MKRVLFLLLPLLFLTSCSRQININTYADIDSLPKGFPKGASFFIFTKPEDKNAFLAKEVTKKIAKVLKDKGYCVTDQKSAQYYLFFDYGIENRKVTIQVPVTVGQTVVSDSGKVSSSYNNSVNYNGQTVATQTAYVPQEVVYFDKTMTVQIYDAKTFRTKNQEEKIWQSSANTIDQDWDLRGSLDFLLIASFEYLGKNTQKSVRIKLKDGDRNIKSLRKSYAQAFECEELDQKSGWGKFKEQTKDGFEKIGNGIKDGFKSFFSKKKKKISKRRVKKETSKKLIEDLS